jgi:hypothetical protein
MKDKSRRRKDGISLAKGPVALIGLALLAYGILNFLFGGNSFSASPIDGTVTGDKFLGIEANGWTNVLLAGSGLLLLFGSPFHWGAKSTAIIVGLVLGAASVISMVDGSDVFGIFATNGLTQLLLGAAATALLLLSLLPKVGKKKHRDHDHDRDRDLDMVDERPRRRTVVERDVITDDRDARFGREEHIDRDRVATGGTHREVVAPADGDGPADRGRETFDRRDRI